MTMLAVAGLAALKAQLAVPLLSCAVEPSTPSVWPIGPRGAVGCAVFSSETKVESWSFDFICCSTCANCTSCWVNWLVSSGSSGFWFLSCVVSSVRNVWKLLVRVLLLVELPDDEDGLAFAAFTAACMLDVTGGMAVAMCGSSVSSDSDIDAAAAAQHLPVD